MKRVWIAVAALALAGALFWYLRRNAGTSGDDLTLTRDRPAGDASVAASGSPVTSADAAAARGGARVARLDREAHKQLVERIAAAKAARAKARVGSGATGAPDAASDANDLARIGPQIKEGLEAAISFLADCYTAKGDARPAVKTAAVNMTLVGDPEIGMVIDADEMFDETGLPLEPALDECLRTTLESLALPPLDTGDAVRLKYSFRFD